MASRKPIDGAELEEIFKRVNPPRNMKLSKNKNSNSRINQTSKCSSVSIDGKTRPMSGLPHEKVNKIGSNPILRSQILSHLIINLAFSLNILMTRSNLRLYLVLLIHQVAPSYI